MDRLAIASPRPHRAVDVLRADVGHPASNVRAELDALAGGNFGADEGGEGRGQVKHGFSGDCYCSRALRVSVGERPREDAEPADPGSVDLAVLVVVVDEHAENVGVGLPTESGLVEGDAGGAEHSLSFLHL